MASAVPRRLIQLGALLLSTSLLAAEHWAFQPLKPGKEQGIDAYIQKTLAQHGLKPSPRADARTLIRRASFDLTGRPPSDVSDTSDLSDSDFAALVDMLIYSPHYGEHWARNLLELASYSFTKGYVYASE